MGAMVLARELVCDGRMGVDIVLTRRTRIEAPSCPRMPSDIILNTVCIGRLDERAGRIHKNYAVGCDNR